MNLSLRPEIERIIDEEIRAGRFPTAEAVVEAAIQEMIGEPELDEGTIASINAAEAQGDRGEGVELDTFINQMEQRSLKK